MTTGQNTAGEASKAVLSQGFPTRLREHLLPCALKVKLSASFHERTSLSSAIFFLIPGYSEYVSLFDFSSILHLRSFLFKKVSSNATLSRLPVPRKTENRRGFVHVPRGHKMEPVVVGYLTAINLLTLHGPRPRAPTAKVVELHAAELFAHGATGCNAREYNAEFIITPVERHRGSLSREQQE